MTEEERKILARSYINAGRDYMASRLARVFAQVKSNDSAAVHNFIAQELADAVGKKDVGGLFLGMADLMMDYCKKGLQE